MPRAAAIIALLCLLVSARDVRGDERNRAISSCQENVARGVWEPDGETLNVIVESWYDKQLDGCLRRLRIVDNSHERPVNLYSEEMAEAPVAILPLGTRLLTIWGSGSAFWLNAYRRDGGRVTKVLDIRPKGLPEIVFSNAGNERVIVPHPDGGAFSDVYLWTGTRYEARLCVPRDRRFGNLD